MNQFAEKLRELRLEKNLSQAELAKVFSVDRRSISNWESNSRKPSYDMLIKIAKYFNVSVDYLIGNEN